MSQDFTDDCFAGGHTAQTDLQNMEDNFAALKSMFSGTAAPANTVAGMIWFDTDNYVWNARNAADSGWYGLMHGDANQKIWVYRNTAMNGWVVDSGVSDTVLALKGGATYTTGAATAGSWTISGITVDAHTHTGPSHTHTFTTGGSSVYDQCDPGTASQNVARNGHTHTGTSDAGGTGATGAASASSITSAGTWRASAAVGTLQYLNL